MRLPRRNPGVWWLAGLALLGGWIGADAYFQKRAQRIAAAEERRRKEQAWKPAHAAGSVAPDFRLPDATGKVHSLRELRGKPLLLAFYSDNHRSRVFAREFQKIWGFVGRERMRAVAVVDFTPEVARQFIAATGDRSLFLYETGPDQRVRRDYGNQPTPSAWVLSKQNDILYATPPIQIDKVPETELNEIVQFLRSQLPRRGSG